MASLILFIRNLQNRQIHPVLVRSPISWCLPQMLQILCLLLDFSRPTACLDCLQISQSHQTHRPRHHLLCLHHLEMPRSLQIHRLHPTVILAWQSTSSPRPSQYLVSLDTRSQPSLVPPFGSNSHHLLRKHHLQLLPWKSVPVSVNLMARKHHQHQNQKFR